MNNMKKVTYIVPVHEVNEETTNYMKKAFTSLANLKGAEKAEIFLTGELDVITQAQSLFNEVCGDDNKQIITLLPTDEKDLFKKINLAVSKCKTPYFSILEFDDEYYPYWDTVAQRYTDKDYSIIVPMAELVTPAGDIAGFANELVWDAAFVDKGTIGFIEHHDLFIFKDFLTSGAYIKTSDFNELGRLKPELKIAAWYEYLLHTVTSGKEIFVAPRVGYRHTILRNGAYMTAIAKELTQEEGVALIKKAMADYPLQQVEDTTEDE